MFTLINSHPCTGLEKPLKLQEVKAPGISRLSTHVGGKVLSPTYRPPLPTGKIPGTHFCYSLSLPHGHSAAGRIKSIKNLKHAFGNRTGDVRACSTVQPSAPQRTPCLH
jgi:hypothetical protein